MRVDVVGAGPAGLMAAQVLAERGHAVAVFDQRRSPARKFVLAGRGGLNITHSEPIEQLLERYGPERRHIEAAVRAFSPNDLRAWCADLGHDTFVGSSGRVFPTEMRAVPLLRSWLARLDALDVELHPQHRWGGWTGGGALRFATPDGQVTSEPDATILALGGASWPQVGSDGSWTEQLRSRGVSVSPLSPANCGLIVDWSSHLIDRFAGSPLKNVSVIVEGRGIRGDPIVTATGLEGGPIYGHARQIREQLEAGPATVTIDLFPDLSQEALERRLASKRPADSVSSWLRRAGFSPVSIAMMRESNDTVIPDAPADIAALAKAVPFGVAGLAGIDRAISTAGGVDWADVDADFHITRLPGVYAVGEMLDWEAPTGGYLLQACFSTGHWAANAIIGREAR